MYLALHSYGQKVIYPWSYGGKKIPDWQELDRVGRVMAHSILRASNGKYKYKVNGISKYYHTTSVNKLS